MREENLIVSAEDIYLDFGGSGMDKFSAVNDEMLFHRLDEIDGEFQDWYISAYKSDLLTKERDEIKNELRKRRYEVK